MFYNIILCYNIKFRAHFGSRIMAVQPSVFLPGNNIIIISVIPIFSRGIYTLVDVIIRIIKFDGIIDLKKITTTLFCVSYDVVHNISIGR